MESSTIPEKNWLRMFCAPRVMPRVTTPALTRMPLRSTPNIARMDPTATTAMTIFPIILNSGISDESMPDSVPFSTPLMTLVTMKT